MPPHPTAAMRLVVDFHGASSDMTQQDIYSGFDPVADRNGFVVATPNGIDAPIRQWRFLGTQDDVNFATAIVRTLTRAACVNRAHAYAVGISSGAAMSASLACQASQTFAGFGLVSADFYLAPICDKAQRRPILIFHGTADPVVPYYGGHVGGPTGTPVQPAETSAALWAAHNGCKPGIVQTRLASQVVRLSWKGCAVPVVMYRIVGGGHTWPGAAIKVKALGLTTEQVSATAEMWKLFSASG
jgi:polyhydroxybutyrate depolymerase